MELSLDLQINGKLLKESMESRDRKKYVTKSRRNGTTSRGLRMLSTGKVESPSKYFGAMEWKKTTIICIIMANWDETFHLRSPFIEFKNHTTQRNELLTMSHK
jgi:hypothetical protein